MPTVVLPEPIEPPTREPTLMQVVAPTLLEGLCTMMTALAAAIVTFRLTAGMGFVDEHRRDAMMAFNLSPPTNTIFRYVACLATTLGVGGLYACVLLRRLGRLALRLDLLAATTMMSIVWWTSTAEVAVVCLVVRATLAIPLASRAATPFIERREKLVGLSAWAPYLALLLGAYILSQLLPPGVPAALVGAPPWLIAVVALPFVLYIIEGALPARALVWERRVGIVLTLVAIPCVTFRVAVAVFDFDTMVGPVNDLLHGKDILDSVVSTYGFLFSYALAGTFWLFRVTDYYIGIAVLNAVAYTVGYGVIFAFLLRRIERLSLCLAAMILIVAVHYFHLHVPITWLPQSGFLRFGGMLPIFLLLYALDERPGTAWLEWCLAACTAVFMFWTVEVGGYIAVGLAAALGRDLLDGRAGLRRVLRVVAKILSSVAVVFVFFVVRIWVRHGHWPIWIDMLHFQRAYSAGLAMGRLTSIERWPIPILVSLVVLFAALRAPQSMRHGKAWLFLAGFGLAAMVYPLGKAPGIFELARVVLPALLLTASFVGFLYRRRADLEVGAGGRRLNLSSAAAVVWLGFAALGTCFVYSEVAPSLAKATHLEETNIKPIAHETPSWEAFFATPERRAQFQLDLAAIRELVPADEALPILSKNDTIYYTFSPRRALFKNSFFPHFFFKSDIDDVVDALLSSKVPYLFIDNSPFQTYENGIDPHIARDVWARLTSRYRPVKRAGLLDVFRRVP